MHQNIELPFLNDYQSVNLGGTSRAINSFDQPLLLGSHHSHASLCYDKCPSTSGDLPFYHGNYNSDLECSPVKEEVHIETSSSPHLPVCPTIHNVSTCVKDTPHSLVSSSNELSPELTQGSEVFHDEIENSLITECTSHSPSSLLL